MPVYFFDLWMTLIHSLPNDPIISLHERLAGNGVKVSRDVFLQACLTTNIADAQAFLQHVGRQFDIAIDDEPYEIWRHRSFHPNDMAGARAEAFKQEKTN